jgi:4-amino-4-deoxy-L-arabinose transferase-like glycosyltransferase
VLRLRAVAGMAGPRSGELRQVADLTRIHALTIVTVLLVATVVALHYVGLQEVPPGFFADEASVAYDAKGIETDGRDAHGVFMPVFFQSFGTWRASLFIYVMALAFKVFGAGVVQARLVASTFSLLTAILLALLAWRLFHSRWLAVATFLVASVTPWLFTTGRFAFEPVSLPTVLAAFLLLWHAADHAGRWYLGLAAGFVLGLTVYAYISAWLFAPLLCAALVIAELPRPRVRLLAGAALGASLATLPMMLFLRAHPDALTARYQVVGMWLPGHPLFENLGRAWRVYTSGFSPEFLFQQAPWILGGEFLAILAPLMVVGLVSLWRLRRERFWRLVLLGILFAPIPGALTADFSHVLRNLEAVPFYLSLAALGAWTLAPLLARERLLAAGLTGLLVFQSVWFLADYFTRLPGRMADWQVAGFQQATKDSLRLAHGGRIQLASNAFAAESGDPQVLEVEFAFLANEDVRDFRTSGISALNAFTGDTLPAVPGTVIVTRGNEQVPGARELETVWVSYPDDWGRPQATPAFTIWQS